MISLLRLRFVRPLPASASYIARPTPYIHLGIWSPGKTASEKRERIDEPDALFHEALAFAAPTCG